MITERVTCAYNTRYCMKRFTQWIRLREEDDPNPMMGGRPVEQIDAQISMTGSSLQITTKKGSTTIELTPDQVQKYQQEMGDDSGMPSPDQDDGNPGGMGNQAGGGQSNMPWASQGSNQGS